MKYHLRYTQTQLDIFFNNPKKYNIIPAGRRTGKTQGAEQACTEWAIEGKKILWGDTVHGNIDRYVDRYFKPTLKANNIPYHWGKQDKVMKIFGGHIDFRSADRPENWEGFGYDIIILNEAGIILKNKYLYTNAVLPMLLDNPDSKLYALGVPKGRILKDNTPHPFYTLYERGLNHKDYKVKTYSSYDNPLLRPEDIKALELEMALMDENMVRQEIYAEFLERDAERPFATQFNKDKHLGEVEYQPHRKVSISIDFNVDPFGAICSHIFREGTEKCHVFDELTIKEGTISKMAEEIKLRFDIANIEITGDAMGNNRKIGITDNLSLFSELKKLLNLRDSQIKIVRNPLHKTSREQVNYFLYHFPEFKINPVTCPNLIRDLKTVQVDAFGSIIKRNRKDISQRADHIDCLRYLINTYLSDWQRLHQKKSHVRGTIQPTYNIPNLPI